MKTSKKPKLKIFLCHASEDKAKVRELYFRLSNEGFDPWLDEEKLLPGQDFKFEISKAVKEAHIVLVCLSNKSIMKSGFVQKEIKYALDQADEQPENVISVIPLKLEECSVPIRLSKWQWLNYFEIKGHEKLVNALKKRCLEIGVAKEVANKEPNILTSILDIFKNGCRNNKMLTQVDFDWISDSRRELYALLDDKELAFALKCSLQHGKNIPFWCKVNSKNPCAIDSIIKPIFENCGRRPLLRSGYAMENLIDDLRQKTFDRLSESINKLKDMGNDIPFKIVDAARNRRTLELWKNDFLNDLTYGTVIKQLIQEISEPEN
ncbi:MAG: toll/interleukin-1 receptor domain-containing protein [Bacteroidetes bacterium]|nr:toll/interleukin-1 receptor domain-containing protein [Bacteroidota bacterium]